MSSGSTGDASIPRRIGAKKATRMHGALANSLHFAASMHRPAAKLSLSRPSGARTRNTSLRWTLIHQSRRARKLCRSGGGRFNHIVH
jgi:hypothetical protein